MGFDNPQPRQGRTLSKQGSEVCLASMGYEDSREHPFGSYLVVGRATSIQLVVSFRQDERVGIPPIFFGRWLDVQVSVHTNGLELGIGDKFSQQDGWQRSVVGGGRIRQQGDTTPQTVDVRLGPIHHVQNILQVHMEFGGHRRKAGKDPNVRRTGWKAGKLSEER